MTVEKGSFSDEVQGRYRLAVGGHGTYLSSHDPLDAQVQSQNAGRVRGASTCTVICMDQA